MLIVQMTVLFAILLGSTKLAFVAFFCKEVCLEHSLLMLQTFTRSVTFLCSSCLTNCVQTWHVWFESDVSNCILWTQQLFDGKSYIQLYVQCQ